MRKSRGKEGGRHKDQIYRLPAEVYERAKDKFKAMMEKTTEFAMAALREEFAGIVSHMIERLFGEEEANRRRLRVQCSKRCTIFSTLLMTGPFLTTKVRPG
jgi:hypothetical protein